MAESDQAIRRKVFEDHAALERDYRNVKDSKDKIQADYLNRNNQLWQDFMKNLESIRRLSAFSNFSTTTTPALTAGQNSNSQKYFNAPSRKLTNYHHNNQLLQNELQSPLLNDRNNKNDR